MVGLAVKHLPKVTLTEVKHRLQWNHKTFGGKKKRAEDCDWRWMKG